MMNKREPLCPFCGAYSTKSCDLEEETGGMCPWEETDDEEERLPGEEGGDGDWYNDSDMGAR